MSDLPAMSFAAPSRWLGLIGSWLKSESKGPHGFSAQPNGEAATPRGQAYRSVRVLIVDDNPVNLVLMAALMESRGLLPLLAADGAEAVALACELHFDLILMDLQMPLLDGLEATRQIRRFELTHARVPVPVVAYSAMRPESSMLAAHGLNASLPKPCADQDLDDCLMRWCPNYDAAGARQHHSEHHR